MATEKPGILTSVPALSDSSLWRYIAFTALYMAQGLPAGLLALAIPAWLAKQGMGTAEIGIYLGIIGLPWSLKFVAGPIMDRFSFLSMGRRRPWILAAQLGIVLRPNLLRHRLGQSHCTGLLLQGRPEHP
jgi:PAT family beta-lactamase induction signal transducer AmpG